jgi:hypothetical protein
VFVDWMVAQEGGSAYNQEAGTGEDHALRVGTTAQERPRKDWM